MMSGYITKVQNIKKKVRLCYSYLEGTFFTELNLNTRTPYPEGIGFISVCGVAMQGGCVWIRIPEFALKNNMFCTCMLP